VFSFVRDNIYATTHLVTSRLFCLLRHF
jgi:hypothetical protein